MPMLSIITDADRLLLRPHLLLLFQEFAPDDPELPTAFGVCILDASTGQFDISSFEDDKVRTKLETLFRQIRPKELIHAKVSVHPSFPH